MCGRCVYVFLVGLLSCGQLFWVHPAFLADSVTQKQDKTCLMLLMLQLLPNVSTMLEQTHIVNTSAVATQTVPEVVLFELFPLSLSPTRLFPPCRHTLGLVAVTHPRAAPAREVPSSGCQACVSVRSVLSKLIKNIELFSVTNNATSP